MHAGGGVTGHMLVRLSTDGGSTWADKVDHIAYADGLNFNSVAIDPNLSTKVAAVSLRDRFTQTVNLEFVYSTDAGVTWATANSTPAAPDADYWSIAYKKSSGSSGNPSQTVFIVGHDDYLGGGATNLRGWVVKSTNAGANW